MTIYGDYLHHTLATAHAREVDRRNELVRLLAHDAPPRSPWWTPLAAVLRRLRTRAGAPPPAPRSAQPHRGRPDAGLAR